VYLTPEHRTTLGFAKHYANVLCSALISEPKQALTDLPGHDSDITSVLGHDSLIVRTMALELRVKCSKPTLAHVHPSHRSDLEREVFTGRCDLARNSKGKLLRTVPVVLFRLIRGGRVLAQVAKLDGDAMAPAAGLPSLIMRGNELPSQTLRRLRAQLALPDSAVKVFHRHVNVIEKKADWYGISTKYIQTIFHANMHEDFDFKTSLPSSTISCETSTITLRQMLILSGGRQPEKKYF